MVLNIIIITRTGNHAYQLRTLSTYYVYMQCTRTQIKFCELEKCNFKLLEWQSILVIYSAQSVTNDSNHYSNNITPLKVLDKLRVCIKNHIRHTSQH